MCSPDKEGFDAYVNDATTMTMILMMIMIGALDDDGFDHAEVDHGIVMMRMTVLMVKMTLMMRMMRMMMVIRVMVMVAMMVIAMMLIMMMMMMVMLVMMVMRRRMFMMIGF